MGNEYSIYIIDIGFVWQQFDVVYFVVDGDCVVFIDCGMNYVVLWMMVVFDVVGFIL